jgi:hypothetical protein
LRRTSQALRPGRRCPTPATVRPQRFSRSRRFPPRHSVPGLFHPGNAPGVSPSGPWSSPGSRTSLEAACSLAVPPVREAGQLRARIAASEP